MMYPFLGFRGSQLPPAPWLLSPAILTRQLMYLTSIVRQLYLLVLTLELGSLIESPRRLLLY